MTKEIKKVVLAYSGGLDTSIIIPWLKENYNNPEVIAVSADVGQADELDGLEAKALATGASKLYILDLKDEFVEDYIYPCLKANAVYEDVYLLGTAFARPLIAQKLVEIALKEGADAICHGCTGKGNDQVRFELGIKAFAPDMTIIAPWRTWELKSRDDDIDYAENVFAGFKNKTSMKSFENTEVFSSVKHILAAKCEDYGFIAGGDDLVVVGKKGRYTEEEIENAAKRWWAYWRDYWRLRNTKDAYEKDWACEVTIPVDPGHPTGNWYEGQDDRQ
jgi:hypothetical protein